MQPPVTMTQIDARARAYAEARDRLRDLVAALDAGMKALQREHLPGIRRALRRAATAEAALHAAIEAAPELFVRPKTVILHGVRVGFIKGKGGIEWDDADRVLALIERHLPDQLDILCKVVRRPSREALAQLDVATLKKLGCRVVDTGEEVFIKPVDGALDKMVEALLKSATEEAKA